MPRSQSLRKRSLTIGFENKNFKKSLRLLPITPSSSRVIFAKKDASTSTIRKLKGPRIIREMKQLSKPLKFDKEELVKTPAVKKPLTPTTNLFDIPVTSRSLSRSIRRRRRSSLCSMPGSIRSSVGKKSLIGSSKRQRLNQLNTYKNSSQRKQRQSIGSSGSLKRKPRNSMGGFSSSRSKYLQKYVSEVTRKFSRPGYSSTSQKQVRSIYVERAFSKTVTELADSWIVGGFYRIPVHEKYIVQKSTVLKEFLSANQDKKSIRINDDIPLNVAIEFLKHFYPTMTPDYTSFRTPMELEKLGELMQKYLSTCPEKEKFVNYLKESIIRKTRSYFPQFKIKNIEHWLCQPQTIRSELISLFRTAFKVKVPITSSCGLCLLRGVWYDKMETVSLPMLQYVGSLRKEDSNENKFGNYFHIVCMKFARKEKLRWKNLNIHFRQASAVSKIGKYFEIFQKYDVRLVKEALEDTFLHQT